MYIGYSTSKICFIQQECIDMILHKIARIGTGDPNKVDHWDDIAGYATLVARYLRNKNEQSNT